MLFSASVSSVSVAAPAPAVVCAFAAARGALWFGVRPSPRSFSGWVGVAVFASSSAAGGFARLASSRFCVPFCVVRSLPHGFAVSVPVFVGVVPSVPAGCLPLAWFSLAVPPLPAAVSSALCSASAVGFSGSRSVVSPALAPACAGVPSGVPVLVGCAAGVDQAVRAVFPSARLFSVAGGGRGAFAARSVAFVRALAGAGGVLLSFPSGPCPAGLLPSSSSARAFCGSGSGSWASLAFAVGVGLPCFVFAPFGVPPAWGFVALGCGWWSVPLGPVQLPLC
jgi:hypothetical protein